MLKRTEGPSCILTTRQNLPILPEATPDKVAKGGYVLFDAKGDDPVLFVATGSEVHLCLAAAKELAASGRGARVVSMPCVELFLRQDAAYQSEVLPATMKKRVLAEAGSFQGLLRFARDLDTTRFLTLDHFGASGPYKVLAQEFGFTAEHALALAKEL